MKRDEEEANEGVLPTASFLIPLNPKLSPDSAIGYFRLEAMRDSSLMKMMKMY